MVRLWDPLPICPVVLFAVVRSSRPALSSLDDTAVLSLLSRCLRVCILPALVMDEDETFWGVGVLSVGIGRLVPTKAEALLDSL